MAQGLTAITLQLEAADQMFASKPEKARAKIGRALELTRQNLEDARRSVLDLRASALQELTLTEALERRMLQFNAEHRESGLSGTFHGDGMYGRLSSRVELSLYRVYEEALDNVARHAGATRVQAALTRDDDFVTLSISDNGRGFDTREALTGRRAAAGFGLVAIRERIRLLHGTFSVESNADDGGGATLQVRVPFEAHHDGRNDRPDMAYHSREGFEHGAIDAAGSGGSSG
jgi:two-component system NarL family sensor kinase